MPMPRGSSPGNRPPHIAHSAGASPHAYTATRIRSGPGSGTGTVRTCRTSPAFPYSSNRTVRIVVVIRSESVIGVFSQSLVPMRSRKVERDPFAWSSVTRSGAWSVLADVESTELRADAARNREALLEAATRTFAASGTEPSMRAIARAAGVGIAAVYRDQVQRLTQGAGALLRQVPPREAMRAWLDLFGDWLSTKHGMIDTLRSMIDSGEIAHTETRDELLAAIAGILDAGKVAGDLRSDVAVEDIAASAIGIFTVTGGRSEQPARLLDLLVDGLRTRDPQT